MPPQFSRGRIHGFTLVELLVALGVMALMAILGWRGLDGLSRAQAAAQTRSDEVLTVQAALGQWNADLAAMLQLEQTQALDWDGRVLRITRRSSVPGDLGPRVVAWTRRGSNGGHGLWLRWQSDPLTARGAWQEAWARAALWAQNPGEAERRGEVSLFALDGWQLFYFRGNAWTNPMSSAGTPSPTATLPDGVRLVLDLPGGQALAGRITSDWVRPTLSPAEPQS